MIKLSKRLSRLADMARYPVLADVGADHGYLPIYLLQAGKIQKAYALDIKKGPLLAAQEHIRACGMEDYIETRLSDGVDALEPGEADTIVIAGMGGDVMLHILTEGEAAVRAAKELILQPQSKIRETREYLYREGYEIDREDMVFEEGNYYPMMRVLPSPKNRRRLAYDGRQWQVIFRYGEQLLNEHDETLRRYLARRIMQYEGILGELKRQDGRKAVAEREKEIRAELAYAQYALKW